jgi:hypothetical protein
MASGRLARTRILAHGYKTGTLYMTTNSKDIVYVTDTSADSKLNLVMCQKLKRY